MHAIYACVAFSFFMRFPKVYPSVKLPFYVAKPTYPFLPRERERKDCTSWYDLPLSCLTTPDRCVSRVGTAGVLD